MVPCRCRHCKNLLDIESCLEEMSGSQIEFDDYKVAFDVGEQIHRNDDHATRIAHSKSSMDENMQGSAYTSRTRASNTRSPKALDAKEFSTPNNGP